MDIQPTSGIRPTPSVGEERNAAVRPNGSIPFELASPSTDRVPLLGQNIDAAFGVYAEASKKFRAETARMKEREAALKASGAKAGDPAWRDFQFEQYHVYYELQLEIQNASLGIEIAAKVIEHATSGARTILQTQA